MQADNRANPQTKTISSAHTTGSHSQCTLKPLWENTATVSNSKIWTSRWMQHDSTVVMGMISRGTGTRLIRPALSTMEVVPVPQATVKKLNGTMPHMRN